MIYNINGDLLQSDCTVIAHQANCHSTMGAGIARAIAIKYPKAESVDADSSMTPKEKFGKYTIAKADKVHIVNLYGQYNMGRGRHTNYKMLRDALGNFLNDASKNIIDVDTSKVGVPFGMGCGLGGGNWEVVKEILFELSELYKVDIYIYKL